MSVGVGELSLSEQWPASGRFPSIATPMDLPSSALPYEINKTNPAVHITQYQQQAGATLLTLLSSTSHILPYDVPYILLFPAHK